MSLIFREDFLIDQHQYGSSPKNASLAINNINIKFTKLEKLTWRSYTAIKVLLTIS